jgi:hypothetical protein
LLRYGDASGCLRVGAERQGAVRGCQRVHFKLVRLWPVLSAGCLSSTAVGLLRWRRRA